MIKKYLAQINSKSTHERRQHAMQLATGITAFAVLVWVTTLGVRYALTPAQIAQSNGTNTSQAASVVDAVQGNATLMVATTTDPSGFQY
jgi:uncharacterized protein (DUF1684 family)